MSWTLSATLSRRIDRGGQLVGAIAAFERPASEATPEDPRTLVVHRYARMPEQSGAQFRTMLLGAGTLANPAGELGATLAGLNAAPLETEAPLA